MMQVCHILIIYVEYEDDGNLKRKNTLDNVQ